MSKTFWFSFGDLKVGEMFVFQNAWSSNKLDLTEKFIKISPRKYRVLTGPDCGREWQTCSKVGVASLSLLSNPE